MTVRNKIYAMRSDNTGCGMFRIGWPAEYLRESHTNVVSVSPKMRGTLIQAGLDKNNNVVQALFPDDMAVIVIQRVTHRHLMQCIPFWQEAGIRVVIDVDDDLSCIHPVNPSFEQLRPKPGNMHSPLHMAKACAIADAVVVTTPALARRYRPDAYVIPNYLPDQYYGLEREDNTDLMWPASFGTHPNDYEPVGTVLQRVVSDTGATVRMLGHERTVPVFEKAFGVTPEITPYTEVDGWPSMLATIGVGFVPLADTKFNEAKSWLKILELSACGVPWVASPRADYSKFFETTGHGVFANKPNVWHRELKKMTTDAGWRREQSVRGLEAANTLRLRDHSDKWSDAWGLIDSSAVPGQRYPKGRVLHV